MNKCLNIYYTLLDDLKQKYHDDIVGTIVLMQEDILNKYIVVHTSIDKFSHETVAECLELLLNFAFYLGERDNLFFIHYNILTEIMEEIHFVPCVH